MGVFFMVEKSHRCLFNELPERLGFVFHMDTWLCLSWTPSLKYSVYYKGVNMLVSCNRQALISPCNSSKWGYLEVKMTALGGLCSCKPPYLEEGLKSHGHLGVDTPAGAPW